MSDSTGASSPQKPDLSRRQFLSVAGAGAAGLYLARSGLLSPEARREVLRSPSLEKTVTGLTLPANAAPLSDQFFVYYRNPTGQVFKALDFYETVYSRAPLADCFSTPLVRINSAYQIVPGVAHSWAQTSPTTWEFYITPGIMWSDGTELTANDFVETFRYSADPKHAWDFTWYWSGVIKNYTEAVAGKVPLSSIGVGVGKDQYTFVVTTEGPVAYMGYAMLYSMPLQAAALSKYGNGLYNINPATSVSIGPWTLKHFNPTSEVVLGPNEKYNTGFPSPIQWQIAKISTSDFLPLLATGAVDYTFDTPLDKTDLEIAKVTPRVDKLTPYINPIDFRCYYVFFKTKEAPFTNTLVRQAFAHSVNRDAIISAILSPLATPAYGFLMDGYPFAVEDPLKPYTNYDPDLAQHLLAQAGYPKGKGFPEVTFSYEVPAIDLSVPATEAVVQALSDNWNEVLFNGTPTLLLQQYDRPTFYKKMEALPTQIEMGFVSYGMDYFDASNMCSVWKSGGRHDWDNPQYDELLVKGMAAFSHAERLEIYTEAQTLLTKEAPGVFIFHGLGGFLMWPYVQGPALAKNYLGYDGIQWPGFYCHSTNVQGVYIGNNVGRYPRQSETLA